MGNELWIKITNFLSKPDYDKINRLQALCADADKTSLKLELDYKLAKGEEAGHNLQELNEFMSFDGDLLTGYIGICGFGGDTLEVNGMVHPDYRRQCIFKKLFSLVKDEWTRRSSRRMLVLSDRNSVSGQAFVKSAGAVHEHSEYEMFIRGSRKKAPERRLFLRKATNGDAKEIARLNVICFNEIDEENPIMPEEEEKCGMEIYIAELENLPVGKIHLETSNGIGGIYGFGILPEYRGMGYGRELLTRGVEILKEKGNKEIKLQVEVKNEKALTLYKSCGFETTSVMDYFEFIK